MTEIEPATALRQTVQVSFVVRHHLKPGFFEQYEAWLRQIMVKAAAYPGHLGVQVMRPPAGGQDYVTVVHFACRADADRWAGSQDRRDLVNAVRSLLEGEDKVDIRSGIDFWFTPDSPQHRHPVRWKQWLVTTSVIWPLTMIVPPAFAPLFSHIPVLGLWGISHGLIAATIVAMVVYFIMPRYVRAVSVWLFR